jgi:hypothetical protein
MNVAVTGDGLAIVLLVEVCNPALITALSYGKLSRIILFPQTVP